MWKLIAVLFVLFILSTAVKADEKVIAEQTMMGSGVLCDTLDQVKEVVKTNGEKKVEGCGMLTNPIVVRIIAIDTQVSHGYKYLLVRYEINGVKEPQYGVFNRIQLTES